MLAAPFAIDAVTDITHLLVNIARPAARRKRRNLRKNLRSKRLRKIEIEEMNKHKAKFPIMREKDAKPHPVSIPWSIAELAYSGYRSRFGEDQSMEELARRGGFAPSEMDQWLPDWRDRCSEIFSILDQLKQSQKLVQELESIVNKLRKTDDGVVMTQGMTVYGHIGDQPRSDNVFVCAGIAEMSARMGGKDGLAPNRGYGWRYTGPHIYSTREAAEQAQEQQKEQNDD